MKTSKSLIYNHLSSKIITFGLSYRYSSAVTLCFHWLEIIIIASFFSVILETARKVEAKIKFVVKSPEEHLVRVKIDLLAQAMGEEKMTNRRNSGCATPPPVPTGNTHGITAIPECRNHCRRC